MKKYVLILLIIWICFTDMLIACTYQPGPCQRKIDSLTWVIKAKDYRLKRVAFYIKLVDKKPSQQKFLKGWVKRAIK